MRDMLPQDMERFRRIEAAFRDVCLGWGYQEVRTPTIEHLHLFTSAGTLSPQMLGRVYSFLDWDGWSGERVVLRPDSTIPAARLYVEQGNEGDTRRLFYVQNVLRFAQGDEPREEWQCGVELIGDTQPQGDVELVLMASEVLQALGLQVEIRLSDPGILRAVLVKAGLTLAEQLALYDRVLDGELSALDEVQERVPGLTTSLRDLLSMEGEGPVYLNNLRSALLPAVPDLASPLTELSAVSEILSQVGGDHRIAPLLVRDFEYYTGPVFHFNADGENVGQGGRYDGLIALVGGRSVPASGFALSVGVLGSKLPAEAAGLPEAIVIRPKGNDRADLAATFALAGVLRRAGRGVRIAGASEPADASYVVAASDGYELVGNGAQRQRFEEADEVARALADRHD